MEVFSSLTKLLNRPLAQLIVAATLGAISGCFGLSGPPFGESLEPYLAPYGYLAVNDGKSGGVFGQECGPKVTVTGKNACQAVTVTDPLTIGGSLLKSPFRAGCTHFLRD